ncbi:hypothetical protein [Cohnella caldifontis]|uniref:hypothetical protein n=1 Tax=Cohnella caldifontis TaxID=3027471 RepID=UPI0023EB7786|nr:hypothetical protein [Cohnella sp. YIM B05605]
MREETYKGLRAVAAENEDVQAIVVPEAGGKLVSLRYKPTGKEWLLDSGSRPLRPPVYGSTFTDGDMSGWDECFPTIDRCQADIGEERVALPDHGEAWSLPWSWAIQGNGLVCSVEGVALPYRLTRTLTLGHGASLSLSYEATNTGKVPVPFLWAAHPQFRADEPTRILLPEAMPELLCVHGGQSLATGRTYRAAEIVRVKPELTGDGTKFYYPGTVPEGWSGLYGEDSGNYLLIYAPVESVPHWGVWIDRGACNDRTAIALEPGIGYYDSLERAVANGTAVTLGPGKSYRWRLDLKLGSGEWRAA